MVGFAISFMCIWLLKGDLVKITEILFSSHSILDLPLDWSLHKNVSIA